MHERNVILWEKLASKYYDNSLALWAKIMRVNYLDEEDSERIFTMRNPPKGSAMWNFMGKIEKSSFHTYHGSSILEITLCSSQILGMASPLLVQCVTFIEKK